MSKSRLDELYTRTHRLSAVFAWPEHVKPLREAAPDLEIRDLDLLEIPPGDSHEARLKNAIRKF